MQIPSVEYYNRVTNELEIEPVMGDFFLRFAYNTLAGRGMWPFLFGGVLLTKLMGVYFGSSLSRWQIKSTIKNLDIDKKEAEFPISHYRTFNDFFARRLKPNYRPFEPSSTQLVSPADGRISVWNHVLGKDLFPVKGAKRTLNELCGEPLTEDCQYAVAIIRLCPGDYHRFHLPCDCMQQSKTRRIKGTYHSVNPIALARNPDIHIENTKEITMFRSDVFGVFRYIEVGAFGVGRIVQNAHDEQFMKMDEKGYFLFGGSTVILVFDAQRVQFDQDLLEHTQEGYETRVKVGNSIADAIVKPREIHYSF